MGWTVGARGVTDGPPMPLKLAVAASPPRVPRGTAARAKKSDPVSPASPEPRQPKPFVKWVGGKRQLLDDLRRWLPKSFGTYHEPFVGGGALFWATLPEKAVLSDNNLRLVRTYKGIQSSVDKVIDRLRSYEHTRDFFEKMRRRQIDDEPDDAVAAWFIYLNKTAYNGLYRVNSKNLFNVPFGDYARPNICDEANLRACAKALANAEVRHEPFHKVARRAKKGDFVYFDPPYVPLSASSMFASYTAEGFGMDDQKRLCRLAISLKKKGVHVLLSNSSAPAVYELFSKDKGFTIHEVMAARSVNSKGSGRGKIPEVVIL